VNLEAIVVRGRIEAVAKVLVVLLFKKNLLPVAALLNDVLTLIYYCVSG
jgi:hypothetical protein